MVYTLLSLFAVVTIIEVVLSARWVPLYFRRGIPLYFTRLHHVDSQFLALAWLVDLYHAQPLTLPFVFRRLSDSEIAFRDGISFVRFIPVLHGMIRGESGSGTLSVVGYANWSVLLVFLGLGFFIGSESLEGGLFIISMFFVAYGIQIMRFRRVANLIKENCYDR